MGFKSAFKGLIQNRHDMHDIALRVAWCVWLCTVSSVYVLDYIWNYNVRYKKFLPSCCHKETWNFQGNLPPQIL